MDDVFTIDSRSVQTARRSNYWPGGKDSFAADRASGDAIAAIAPTVSGAARASREAARRIVGHLVREGIRQFIDLGCGLPDAPNIHDVAQHAAPSARVVYIDHDPMVLAHARALHIGTPEGTTHTIDADIRDAHLVASRASHVLDLAKPVGILMIDVLQEIPDDGDARQVVNSYREHFIRGGVIAVTHPAADLLSPTERDALASIAGADFHPRTRAEIAAVLHRLRLVDPGLVPAIAWRPDGTARSFVQAPTYAAVARLE